MARKIPPLTDTQIKKAKPADSPLRDGNGLLLFITENSKQELEALADRLNLERVKQRHARQAKVKAGLAQLMAVLKGGKQ